MKYLGEFYHQVELSFQKLDKNTTGAPAMRCVVKASANESQKFLGMADLMMIFTTSSLLP
jgi:hypothetical protein